MDNGTYVAVSRLTAQMRAMDVVASNLANANTPGYHAERMAFSDWLVHETGGPRGDSSLVFPQDRATYRDSQNGQISRTGNPLDLAITGAGYFTVMSSSGPRLTRAGHFTLGTDGTVTDEAGEKLLDDAGQNVQLSPADSRITVAGDGTISSENGVIGKIGVVNPADPNQLQAEGGRRLNASATTTQPVASPQIVQGSVEDSNVEPIAETTRMMSDLRNYQMVTQYVEAESERQQNAIDKIMTQRS